MRSLATRDREAASREFGRSRSRPRRAFHVSRSGGPQRQDLYDMLSESYSRFRILEATSTLAPTAPPAPGRYVSGVCIRAAGSAIRPRRESRWYSPGRLFSVPDAELRRRPGHAPV